MWLNWLELVPYVDYLHHCCAVGKAEFPPREELHPGSLLSFTLWFSCVAQEEALASGGMSEFLV